MIHTNRDMDATFCLGLVVWVALGLGAITYLGFLWLGLQYIARLVGR